MEGARLDKADALAAFFLYILAYFAFGHLAAWLNADALALQCAFELCVGAIPFLCAALRRIPFGTFFRLGNFSPRLLAGGILCMAGASVLAGEAGIATAFLLGPSASESGKALGALLSSYPRPHLFLASAALPALCEETLFRGFILCALRKSPDARSGLKGEPLAISVSALLFALAHMDIARFFPSLIAGLAISYAACASGSFLVPVAMHLFNNSAALVLYFASPAKVQGGMEAWAADLPPSPLLALAAAISLALILAGARIVRKEGRKPLSQRP